MSFTIYFKDVYNICNIKDIKWFHGKYNTLQCTSMTRSLNQCLLWVSSKLPAMIFKVQQVSVWSKTAKLCRHSVDTVWGMCWNASRGPIYPSLIKIKLNKPTPICKHLLPHELAWNTFSQSQSTSTQTQPINILFNMFIITMSQTTTSYMVTNRKQQCGIGQ